MDQDNRIITVPIYQSIQGGTNMKTSSFVALKNALLVGASLFPIAVVAHHSRAHYGQEIVEMDAEIMDIDWRNPHVTFTTKAKNAAGEDEISLTSVIKRERRKFTISTSR